MDMKGATMIFAGGAAVLMLALLLIGSGYSDDAVVSSDSGAPVPSDSGGSPGGDSGSGAGDGGGASEGSGGAGAAASGDSGSASPSSDSGPSSSSSGPEESSPSSDSVATDSESMATDLPSDIVEAQPGETETAPEGETETMSEGAAQTEAVEAEAAETTEPEEEAAAGESAPLEEPAVEAETANETTPADELAAETTESTDSQSTQEGAPQGASPDSGGSTSEQGATEITETTETVPGESGAVGDETEPAEELETVEVAAPSEEAAAETTYASAPEVETAEETEEFASGEGQQSDELSEEAASTEEIAEEPAAPEEETADEKELAADELAEEEEPETEGVIVGESECFIGSSDTGAINSGAVCNTVLELAEPEVPAEDNSTNETGEAEEEETEPYTHSASVSPSSVKGEVTSSVTFTIANNGPGSMESITLQRPFGVDPAFYIDSSSINCPSGWSVDASSSSQEFAVCNTDEGIAAGGSADISLDFYGTGIPDCATRNWNVVSENDEGEAYSSKVPMELCDPPAPGHTHTATVSPTSVAGGSTATLAYSVANNGPSPVWRIRVDRPSGSPSFNILAPSINCGTGWHAVNSSNQEKAICDADTPADNLEAGQSRDVSFDALFDNAASCTSTGMRVRSRDTGTGDGIYDSDVSLEICPPPITIVATKIVCNSESDLPNWGAGGPDVTATTASDFLAANQNCHAESGWNFQWGFDTANPGDNTGAALGWNTFGPTDASGTASAIMAPQAGTLWAREEWKDGYIPFTGQNTNQPLSAEIYCATDVLNYDNYDRVDNAAGGNTYYCVAFNVPTTGTLTVNKVVINDNGGSLDASQVPLFVDGNGVTNGAENVLAPAIYTVSETNPAGYAAAFSGDCDANGSVAIAAGDNKTCTITNDDLPGTLTVIKHVINDNGGTAVASDFTMYVVNNGIELPSFPGDESGTNVSLNAGNYGVSETGPVADYNATYSEQCTGPIMNGEARTCTVTNDDMAPELYQRLCGAQTDLCTWDHTLPFGSQDASSCNLQYNTEWPLNTLQTATCTFDGSQYADHNFYLSIDNDVVNCTLNGVPFVQNFVHEGCALQDPRSLQLSTNGTPNSFALSPIAGTNTIVCTVRDRGVQTFFDACVVGNGSPTGTLTVTKVVINDDQGTAAVEDFPLYVDQAQVTSGAQNEFAPGIYTVSESQLSGYTASFSGDCDANGSITLSAWDNKTCTITNDDMPAPVCDPQLELIANGGFESPEVTHGTKWDIFNNGTAGMEWGVAWMSPPGTTFGSFTIPEIASLELHENVIGAAYEGDQYAELDGDWNGHAAGPEGEQGSTKISQTIATVPGEGYVLSFAYSPRTAGAADNVLEVRANGVLLATLSRAGTGSTNWTTHSYTFTADSSTTVIEFSDAGTRNSLGTLVDDVSLLCSPSPQPEPAYLVVYKHVINDNGGTADASDFNMSVNGTNVSSPSFPGYENGTIVSLEAGAYSISETQLEGQYVMSLSENCSGTIASGETRYCTVTNDDMPRQPLTCSCTGGEGDIYADCVDSYQQGKRKDGTPVVAARSNANASLHANQTSGQQFDYPNPAESTFFATGFGGNITLCFNNEVENRPGNDLHIYETTYGPATSYPPEKAMIEGSADGYNYVLLSPSITRDSDVDLDLGPLPTLRFLRISDISDKSLSGFDGAADAYDVDAVAEIPYVAPMANGTLTIYKIVDGGPLNVSDFTATLNGSNVSWATPISLAPGSYAVSEIPVANYTLGHSAGDCDANGSVAIAAGGNKSCTLTNTYAPSNQTSTNVTGCMNITMPGTYVLTQSLFSNGSCIIISSDDVDFSCEGYSISDSNLPGSVGVHAINSDNVTVRDCTISNFQTGIYFQNSNGSHSIYGNNITVNMTGGIGISLLGSFGTAVHDDNVYVYGAGTGVSIQSGANNSISACSVVAMTSPPPATDGIAVSSSPQTTVANCDVEGFGNAGIHYTGSSNGNIYGNTVNTWKDGGLALQFNGGSSNSHIYNNTFHGQTSYAAVNYGSSSINNTLEGNTIVASGTASAGAVYVTNAANGGTYRDNLVQSTVNGGPAMWLNLGQSGNTVVNNTFITANGTDLRLAASAGNNLIYWNHFGNTSNLYVEDLNGSNHYNISNSPAQGNYWPNVLDGSVLIYDSDADGWGDTGPDYPYSAATAQGKFVGTGTDYGPYTLQASPFSNASLRVTLLEPANPAEVEKGQFFTVTANVSCEEGYCGDVNVTLDPNIRLLVYNPNSPGPLGGASCRGSYGSLPYAYLAANGVDVTYWCNSNVVDASVLANYDAIYIGRSRTNFGYPPSYIDSSDLRAWVQNGGGVILESNGDNWEPATTTNIWPNIYDMLGYDNCPGIEMSDNAGSGTMSQLMPHPIWEGVTPVSGYGLYEGELSDSCVGSGTLIGTSTFGAQSPMVNEFGSGRTYSGVLIDYPASGVNAEQYFLNIVKWVAGGASKGAIPVGSGTPFYTTSPNPATPSDSSCLALMASGSSCVVTWSVNATGNGGSTWEFYAIANSSGNWNESNRVNVTILDTARLTVTKVVVNDNGGTANESGFQAMVDGLNVSWGVQYEFAPGAHAVSETELSGYSATFSGDCDANGSVALSYGDNKTCTITNDDMHATLTVYKHVINDNGGTAVASDFNITANGTNASPSGFTGDENGTLVALDAGSYIVSEDVLVGYSASYSAGCSGIASINESLSCTITNDDNAPANPPGPGPSGPGSSNGGGFFPLSQISSSSNEGGETGPESPPLQLSGSNNTTNVTEPPVLALAPIRRAPLQIPEPSEGSTASAPLAAALFGDMPLWLFALFLAVLAAAGLLLLWLLRKKCKACKHKSWPWAGKCSKCGANL